MKYFLVVVISLAKIASSGQSPYLSIIVKMDSVKAIGTRYKIEMKICTIKSSERGDWFTHDTSKIDFTSLKLADLDCGEYFDDGLPTLISGQEEEKPINQFEFGNQHFAWEQIFVYRISNMSSRGWMPEMYIVIPVKYKSFFTKINITDIEFQSGKVICLTDLEGSYGEKYLALSQSLKNKTGIEVKNFMLKEALK
jgi:hypothetical protein